MASAEPVEAIRALVVAADGRYRERAETVIGEVAAVAFAHVAPTAVDDVWWLVQQERANVVVLDATDCEAAVADIVARLSKLAPELGVVVVCEHLTDAARDLEALPKWGWRRELRAAVQHARLDGSPLARPQAPWKADRRDLRGVTRVPINRR
jgi:hypothetical protein